jgi:uncharacterized protein
MTGLGWNLVAVERVLPQAWRNGGGVTRELLAWPDARDWKVRLSVAEVERDGPFSHFPGVERWFAVLQGAGVRLDIDGAAHTALAGGEPLRFAGTAAVDCRLIDGPTRDFNLMLRGTAGRLQRVRGTLERNVDAMTLIAVHSGPERAAARFGSKFEEIPPHTLAWRVVETGGPLRIESEDALWLEAAP